MTSSDEIFNVNSGNVKLDNVITQWMQWDKNSKTRNEIQSLVATKNWEILRNRLLHRMTFGTAGLRGVMRAGFDSMNDLVIIQTAQGLVKYVKDCYASQQDQKRGIVVSYDGRYNSKRLN
jgi:phosphomannomutase